MNNPYSHHKRPEMHSRRTLSLVKKDKTESRTIMTAHLGVPGLDRQFLMARKQNYLNTGYNNRRQRLQDITLQNQKIYVKINTQKSAYSRRLSSSKISNRQSSRSSMRSSKIQKRKITKPKPKQSYFFQPHSLTHIKATQLENFTKIFKKEAENKKPSQISLKKQRKNRKNSSISKQTINQNTERQIKFKLPTINTKKSYKKAQYLTNALGLLNNNQGALLHVIAQEMFGKAKLKI